MDDATWSTWHPDILGEGYEQATIDLGHDPDGQGNAKATLVRATAGADDHERAAVLWLPGMSDYFFQTHVAERLVGDGLAFYALDLRACGRSLRADQRPHFTTDLRHYFPELQHAVTHILRTHPGIVIAAHSTGGLIATVWLDWLRGHNPQRYSRVRAIVLDSPWLALQFGTLRNPFVRLFARAIGSVLPKLKIPGGGLAAYGQSLVRRWDVDPGMKPVEGHPKYAGWLRAVVHGMARVERMEPFHIPALTLTSTESWLNKPYSAASDTADTVLDVTAIWPVARRISTRGTVLPVSGAIHDVYLSLPLAQATALDTTSQFIAEVLAAPNNLPTDEEGHHD